MMQRAETLQILEDRFPDNQRSKSLNNDANYFCSKIQIMEMGTRIKMFNGQLEGEFCIQ